MNQIITSPFAEWKGKDQFILRKQSTFTDWVLENVTIEIKNEGWIEVNATAAKYASFHSFAHPRTRWTVNLLEIYDLEGYTVDECTELIHGTFINWLLRIKKTRVIKRDQGMRIKSTVCPFNLKISHWSIQTES